MTAINGLIFTEKGGQTQSYEACFCLLPPFSVKISPFMAVMCHCQVFPKCFECDVTSGGGVNGNKKVPKPLQVHGNWQVWKSGTFHKTSSAVFFIGKLHLLMADYENSDNFGS